MLVFQNLCHLLVLLSVRIPSVPQHFHRVTAASLPASSFAFLSESVLIRCPAMTWLVFRSCQTWFVFKSLKSELEFSGFVWLVQPGCRRLRLLYSDATGAACTEGQAPIDHAVNLLLSDWDVLMSAMLIFQASLLCSCFPSTPTREEQHHLISHLQQRDDVIVRPLVSSNRFQLCALV